MRRCPASRSPAETEQPPGTESRAAEEAVLLTWERRKDSAANGTCPKGANFWPWIPVQHPAPCPAGPAPGAVDISLWRSGVSETKVLKMLDTRLVPVSSFFLLACLPLIKSHGEKADVLHGIADSIESIMTTLVGYQCFFQGDVYF